MLDYRDGIGVIGCGLLIGGVALWSVPAALVLSGVGVLGLYFLLETRGATQSPAEQPIEVKSDKRGP